MSDSTTTMTQLPARTHHADAVSQRLAHVQTSLAPGAVDLPSLVPLMYTFLFRNIASDGFTFSDPQSPGDLSKDSKPGCIIAAPSFPADTPGIDEDYVFNWVRDGALTAMEVAKATMPIRPGGAVQTLNDYVQCDSTLAIETVEGPDDAYLQLQYAQIVPLCFGGISYPHVTVGTLIKSF